MEVGRDWVWREDRIQDLLSTEDADVLFLSGCAENMPKFFPQFDLIVLLSTSASVIVERLHTKTTNQYGKRPGEPDVWQSFSGPDDSGRWNCTIARGIRRFRGITTIEDYQEKRNPSRPQSPSAPSLPLSIASASPVSSISIHAGMLHSDIATRCWNLYLQGEYDNTILNATKAIEVAVRNKAQLADTVVGVNVITTAFSQKKPLLQYSNIEAEQEGLMFLLRGIIQVYKNPRSHRFVGTQDASECLGILLLCSSLLSMIDHMQKIEHALQ